MSGNVKSSENQTFQPVEVETADEKLRREWADKSGDWAWQVLKFLQGHRKIEISLTEIVTPHTDARSTQREKDSLRFVAAQAEQYRSPSDENRRRLIERDDFLMKFVAGETLG